MPQSVRTRRHGIIEYVQNGVDSMNLSRGMVLREIYLFMTMQPAVSGANNTAANTLRGDEWSALNRIRLIANGTDVIFDMSGNALWWLNYFLYGTAPPVAQAVDGSAVILGDGATANPSVESLLILPLWMPRSIRPIDSALDTRQLSDLQLEVTWGSHLSINASATGFTTTPRVEVFALESFGLPRNTRFAQWRRWEISRTVVATDPRFEIDLPVGGVYRSFLVNTDDAGVDQGDILRNFKFRSGNVEFQAMDARVFQLSQRLRQGQARGFSGTAYDDLRVGNANSLDGWYWIDLVTDGFLSEAIDTVGFSEAKIEADVVVGGGTTTMRVYPQVLIPVRDSR